MISKSHRRALAIAAACACMSASAATSFTSFTFENDVFTGTDRHYTNGMQAAFLVDLDAAPEWLRDASADPQAVLAIGQRIYTPGHTRIDGCDPHDRPYAGWLYMMGDLRTRGGPTIDHVTLAVGVVGPDSLARRTQNGVHRLLGEEGSNGWDTQVRDRTTLMLGYERAWPRVAEAAFGSRQADLALRAGANVGTPLTYADVGAVARYGSNLPNDIPVTHISLGPPRDGFRGAAQFGWYVWAGLDARAVAYNTFIQGSTYNGGPRVSRETYGSDAQVGVAAVWPRARVGFTIIERSKEFVGQSGADRFGQLVVSFAF